MKIFKYIVFLCCIMVLKANTFALDDSLLEKEKKYISELLPSMMLNGHRLDLHKDLALNPNSTEIVSYNLKTGDTVMAWDIVTVNFSDGTSIQKGIDGYSVSGSDYANTYFWDTKGHWAEEDIKKAYNKGLISGLGDYFGVNTPIKMHDMTVILNRAFIRVDFPIKYSNKRSDINKMIEKGHWASADLSNMMGYMLDRVDKFSNYNGTLYGFELTRKDMADMLRSLVIACQNSYSEMNKTVGLNVDAMRTYTKPGAVYISDLEQDNANYLYWMDSINHVIRAGLMSTDKDNSFNCNKPVTRAELAIILNRLEEFLMVEKEIYDIIYEKYIFLSNSN